MIAKLKNYLALLLVMVVIIALGYLVFSNENSAETKTYTPSEKSIENLSISDQKEEKNNLSHYRKLLESHPFLLEFNSTTGQANDTTTFLKGYSRDKSITAAIHYDPRDEEFYWIEFSAKNIPFNPNRSDTKPLLDFTNLFDSGFTSYFDRNFNGIFKNENDFVDDGRYINREKGLVFIIEGDVASNNMDIKKYPNRKADIIAMGNFVSINVINTKKPSWMFNDFEAWKLVEK